MPAVSIGYNMKARGINKDIFGHTDWLVPLKQLEPGTLSEKVSALLDAAPAVAKYLADVMPAYREGARLAVKYARKAMVQGR